MSMMAIASMEIITIGMTMMSSSGRYYDCCNVISDGDNCDDSTQSRTWCKFAEYMSYNDHQ